MHERDILRIAKNWAKVKNHKYTENEREWKRKALQKKYLYSSLGIALPAGVLCVPVFRNMVFASYYSIVGYSTLIAICGLFLVTFVIFFFVFCFIFFLIFTQNRNSKQSNQKQKKHKGYTNLLAGTTSELTKLLELEDSFVAYTAFQVMLMPQYKRIRNTLQSNYKISSFAHRYRNFDYAASLNSDQKF